MDRIIEKMDFKFFGTGQHKIDAESFIKKDNAVMLDVRAKEETETLKISLKHHFPVLEIPFNELPARLKELPVDKFIGIFCSSGVRSAITFGYLRGKGLENVRMIEGGYTELTQALLPGKIYKHLNKVL